MKIFVFLVGKRPGTEESGVDESEGREHSQWPAAGHVIPLFYLQKGKKNDSLLSIQ